MRLIILLLLLLLSTYVPVRAAPESNLSVMTTTQGKPSSGHAVTVVPVDDSEIAMIVLLTNERGIADFGTLSDGEYTVDVCNQEFVFSSTNDSTGALMVIECENRSLLPIAFH